MQFIDIADLTEGRDAPIPLAPVLEAQIATLRELASAYWRTLDRNLVEQMKSHSMSHPAFPFRLGDLVTPRQGVSLIGAGIPQIVVETRLEAEPFQTAAGWGSVTFGARLNIRVLGWNTGCYCMFWNEAWMHVPYQGPSHSN